MESEHATGAPDPDEAQEATPEDERGAEPPAEQADPEPQPGEDPDTVLLGLYEGVPLTERDSWWDAGSLPDRITIYRQPILDICSSREDVVEEVAITVIHEIAHHFGIDDQRLHELGWD